MLLSMPQLNKQNRVELLFMKTRENILCYFGFQWHVYKTSNSLKRPKMKDTLIQDYLFYCEIKVSNSQITAERVHSL